MPIEIKAVAEGMPVDVGNVLMTVENTDKRCYWLVNYLESLIDEFLLKYFSDTFFSKAIQKLEQNF